MKALSLSFILLLSLLAPLSHQSNLFGFLEKKADQDAINDKNLHQEQAATSQGQHHQKQKKCRALALEGGGDAGAWEAGVIAGMVEKLSAEESQYDVISGVSVGSLTAFFMSTYEKGDEKEMSSKLLDMWKTMTRDKVYHNWSLWYFGIAQGFWNKKGIFDNTPFRELVKKQVESRAVKRKLTIGVTDAVHATSLSFDGDKLSKDELTKTLWASTAMPFIFPYVQWDKENIYVDGGVLLNVDVHSAVKRCKEIVSDEKDIIIDVILPTGAHLQKLDPTKEYTAWEMYKRYKELTYFKGALDDVIHAMIDLPDVQFRYVIMPTKPIPSNSVPISFNVKSIQQMIEMGKEDAKTFIENPMQGSLANILKRRRQVDPNNKKNDEGGCKTVECIHSRLRAQSPV